MLSTPPTLPPAICSRSLPVGLFFKALAAPWDRKGGALDTPPQGLHLASIMLLLVGFLLTLQILIKVFLCNKCSSLVRGPLIKKKKKKHIQARARERERERPLLLESRQAAGRVFLIQNSFLLLGSKTLSVICDLELFLLSGSKSLCKHHFFHLELGCHFLSGGKQEKLPLNVHPLITCQPPRNKHLAICPCPGTSSLNRNCILIIAFNGLFHSRINMSDKT